MNKKTFMRIIEDVREETFEPCLLEVSSVHASCDCNDRPTIYFDEVTEDDAYEFVHSHAAHNNMNT